MNIMNIMGFKSKSTKDSLYLARVICEQERAEDQEKTLALRKVMRIYDLELLIKAHDQLVAQYPDVVYFRDYDFSGQLKRILLIKQIRQIQHPIK